jgi:hypothetical protein
MSSGNKEIVVNPLERALSGDIMRGQNFAGAMLSELMRAMLDTSLGFDDESAGGLYLPNSSQGTPAYAEVVNGILFTPGITTTASAVGPGLVFMYDPDASPSPDDSQYKLLLDPGTNSSLTPSTALTANASGSIRIDVLECARVTPDNVLETDSRDVFNTVTGTFAAASVSKVSQAQLQYRIRLGTPGSGYPGGAAGWMPICVMSVPTGTTTWDTVTVWDVRPLLADRVRTPWRSAVATGIYNQVDFATSQATAGQFRLNGLVDVVPSGGDRRLGGWLERGSPGVDHGGYVDLYDPANQASGYSYPGSGTLSFLYLLTPFSLPRWARYTDSSFGVRQPRSPRGIPLVAVAQPQHWGGAPNTAVVFPAVFGFAGASTSQGICIGATTSPGPSALNSITSSNRAQQMSATPATTATSTTINTTKFTLTENVHFPAGAKRIRAIVTITISVPATATMVEEVSWLLQSNPVNGGDGFNALSDGVFFSNSTGSPVNQTTIFMSGWLALPTSFPATAAQSYTLTVTGQDFNTGVTPSAVVLEWEF